MLIQLTKIPTFWLTCEKSSNRWHGMEEMLGQLEIPATKINGPITNPYTFGIRDSHLYVLKSNQNNIVHILEDDAAIVDYRENFLIPDATDALYLGTSLYGRNLGRTQINGVVAKKEKANYLRVFNMLGMHSIVYISKRYREHVIQLLENFDGEGGVDDAIADSMSNFNIYAPQQPVFYQNDGHSNGPTKTPITPIF